MASQFDLVRNRKRGEEAKKRVLERVYSPKPEPQQQVSMFDAIRNRSLEPIEEPAAQSQASSTSMFRPSDLNPLNSTWMRAGAGDKAAQKAYTELTGVEFKPVQGPPPPPQLSEYEKGLQEIEENRPSGFWGNVYDVTVAPWAKLNNKIWYDNPVGGFVTRSVGTGAETVLGTPSARPGTTGNATADKIADIAGTAGGVLGLGFNPSMGPNLITGPLKAAQAALNTGVGQKAQRALSYGINSAAPRMSTTTANRLARTGLEGAMTGAIGGAATGLVQGQDSNQEIARNALLGAGLGAAGDMALTSIGNGLRNALTKINSSKSVPEIEEILLLPESTQYKRMMRSQGTRLPEGTEPIIPPTNWTPEPLGLPQADIAPPTVAKRKPNEYRTKFENLMRVANDYQFTPGREAEELESLWGQMADRNDPGLDELIDLAYPRRSVTPRPGMIEQARNYQMLRDVYGVGNPVKSMSERAPSYVGQAAPPVERIGFRPGSLNRGSTQRPTATTSPDINASVPPRSMINNNAIEPDPININPRSAIPDQPFDTADAMKGNLFTNLFGDQGVGISAFGSNKRMNAGPLTTADQIVKNSIKNDTKGLVDEAAAKARAAYQNFVDWLSPLKKFGDNTYQAAMDTARSNNIANTIVRDKFVTPEGNVIGEGLNNIFKKIARGQDKEFVDYLTLRHAQTRVARGERVYAESLGMTPEKIRERIAMYDKRHPGFAEIAREWDRFNDNILQVFGVNEGLITQELKDELRRKNPFYSPMRRQFSRSEKPGKKWIAKSTSSSFSGQKAPLQKVSPTGSVRDIVDPRKTTVEMVGSWTNAAMNNRVMQEIVYAITRNPERYKGIAQIVQKPKDKVDLKKILLDGGMDDFAEAINDDYKNLFKSGRLDDDNIVRAMVDGRPVYVQVQDPEVVKTLIGMGPQATNLMLDVATAFSNATKRGATGALAPIFAVKGATMDLVQSAIQAKNPAKQAAYTVYGILSGIADRLNIPGLRNMAQDFRRSGGEYSAALKGDRKLNRNISDMTRDPLLSPKGIAKGVKNTVAFPFRALEEIGNIAENAPRMAAFNQELKRLGGERTPENVRKAMEAAREVTVNFSRRGALSRDIESFVPYNNAAVQGTYRVLKGLKQNPGRTALAIGALAVAPKMYEYMQFHDDPDYQKIPARERYRFLFVNKNADGTFTKIPMEPAYNSFGEITIEALRAFQDKDPNAFKGAADAIANAWLPPVVTGALQGVTQGDGVEGSIGGSMNATIFAPAAAVYANRSFTGAPIESRSLENYSPENRYDERTSSIAKELGKLINMSPKKIDYLIRAYGGDPARLLLPLTSEQGGGNVRNTLLKNFIADPEFTNTLSTDFYNAKDKLTQAYYDARDGRGEIPSWFNPGLYKMITSQANGSVSKRLSELNKQKRAIGADKTLSAEVRADRQREIQRKINEIYIDVNQRLEEAGVPLK